MAEETGISWADATMNPWIGCAKVSPGCAHCYAETMVTGRMGRPGTWGEDGTRRRTSAANWRKPLRWAQLAREGLLPNGKPNPDGHRPRVFCASLADVFEPRPELDPWRYDLFTLIEDTPPLDWLILTKRPEVARDWLGAYYGDLALPGDFARPVEPLANVWVGTSIENARHTFRADLLREVPAAVRFISAEPLLGSFYPGHTTQVQRRHPPPGTSEPLDLTGVDWVIVGGESGGRDARPMQVEWAREIRDAINTPWGNPHHDVIADLADPSRWRRPAFHFKQWGSHDANGAYRGPGPKSGGKLLDGAEWCEFPASAVPVPA